MKIILTPILLLICCIVHAQIFIGMATNTNSAELQTGYFFKNMEASVVYKLPFFRADIATILSGNIGRKFSTGNTFYLITSAGIANYRIKSFTHSDHPEEGTYISIIAPNFRLEEGINLGLGTAFLAIDYCRNLYSSVGIKCYVK